jgi:DNA-binding CsgD family transcriptional regulator
MEVTKKTISKMLAEGIPQADCARILGRSRQRIKQLTTVQMMGAYKKVVRKQCECLEMAIKRKISDGMAKKDIARDLIIPMSLYYKLAPKNSLSGNIRRGVRTEIIFLAKKGFSVREIAEELGMKQNNVRRYISSIGTKVKNARISV